MKYESSSETAKKIRLALKKAFPKLPARHFSVKSSTYSGGSSVSVRWEDYPTEKEVKVITDKFASATFDGMQDLKEYTGYVWEEDGQMYNGADFIFAQIDYSDEKRLLAEFICKNLYGNYDMNRNWQSTSSELRKIYDGMDMDMNLVSGDYATLWERFKALHDITENKVISGIVPNEILDMQDLKTTDEGLFKSVYMECIYGVYNKVAPDFYVDTDKLETYFNVVKSDCMQALNSFREDRHMDEEELENLFRNQIYLKLFDIVESDGLLNTIDKLTFEEEDLILENFGASEFEKVKKYIMENVPLSERKFNFDTWELENGVKKAITDLYEVRKANEEDKQLELSQVDRKKLANKVVTTVFGLKNEPLQERNAETLILYKNLSTNGEIIDESNISNAFLNPFKEQLKIGVKNRADLILAELERFEANVPLFSAKLFNEVITSIEILVHEYCQESSDKTTVYSVDKEHFNQFIQRFEFLHEINSVVLDLRTNNAKQIASKIISNGLITDLRNNGVIDIVGRSKSEGKIGHSEMKVLNDFIVAYSKWLNGSRFQLANGKKLADEIVEVVVKDNLNNSGDLMDLIYDSIEDVIDTDYVITKFTEELVLNKVIVDKEAFTSKSIDEIVTEIKADLFTLMEKENYAFTDGNTIFSTIGNIIFDRKPRGLYVALNDLDEYDKDDVVDRLLDYMIAKELVDEKPIKEVKTNHIQLATVKANLNTIFNLPNNKLVDHEFRQLVTMIDLIKEDLVRLDNNKLVRLNAIPNVGVELDYENLENNKITYKVLITKNIIAEANFGIVIDSNVKMKLEEQFFDIHDLDFAKHFKMVISSNVIQKNVINLMAKFRLTQSVLDFGFDKQALTESDIKRVSKMCEVAKANVNMLPENIRKTIKVNTHGLNVLVIINNNMIIVNPLGAVSLNRNELIVSKASQDVTLSATIKNGGINRINSYPYLTDMEKSYLTKILVNGTDLRLSNK